MSYREIPENRILKFPSTAGFKGWKPFFSEDSISHPAKMNLNLLRWILSKYTKPSETVLDPMSGTGSTIVLASMMGRDGVAVEFEPKFCDMIQDNIARAEKQATFTAKGRMKCYQGDARELSKLLGESDAIITSPPYGNRLSDVAIQDGDPARMGYRQTVDIVLTSPPYSGKEQTSKRSRGWGPWNLPNQKNGFKQDKPKSEPYEYSESESQIGNLKYGEIDSIVTSPPYGSDNANLQAREDKSAQSVLASTGVRGVELDPENLGNLEYGDIDTIVTSPPYEQTISNESGGNLGSEEKRSLRLMREYSEDSDNIGNLKSGNYLEAMLQVYRESHKVLKPEGTMVLVTKNFIRDKAVVRLDLDTIKLCEKAGFKLLDRWYFELPTKSFWKILYQRKYPSVPTVDYEDVLVFMKEAEK